MPIIIKNEEKNYLQETTGLKIESLTDSRKLESPVMVVNRLLGLLMTVFPFTILTT